MHIRSDNSLNGSITTLPASPSDDRRHRLHRYVFTMSVRVVCFVGAVLLHDAWSIVPLVLAGVIPWVAVIVANAGNRQGSDLVQPGGALVLRGPGDDAIREEQEQARQQQYRDDQQRRAEQARAERARADAARADARAAAHDRGRR